MSTEPKPAAVEAKLRKYVDEKYAITEPASGEWTEQSVAKILAESHNAALAAAWRKGHADAQAPALERIDELHQQLAAERAKVAAAEATIKEYEDYIKELDQIAGIEAEK